MPYLLLRFRSPHWNLLYDIFKFALYPSDLTPHSLLYIQIYTARIKFTLLHETVLTVALASVNMKISRISFGSILHYCLLLNNSPETYVGLSHLKRLQGVMYLS